MNKLGSLTGAGALLLNGKLIARAQYEIMVNQDEAGSKLAFGSMQVSNQAISVIERGVGSYSLKLEKSGTVELTFSDSDIAGNIISFDISGPVPATTDSSRI